MRTIIFSILILLVTGLSFQATAQVTAVMQAKVEIISGAGFTLMENSFIDLTSDDVVKDFSAGSFSLVSAPGTDVNVHLENVSGIENEFGEAIEFESLDLNKQSTESGQHHISINGKVKNGQELKGHYKGSITAVVEYL